MEKNLNNKHIKYVLTIGDSKRVLNELKERASKYKIEENKIKYNSELSKLIEDFNTGVYDNSSVFSEHIKNKNGKYIVFCRETEDIKNTIAEVPNLFKSINSNVKIFETNSKMKKRTKDNAVKKFIKNNDQDSLKLLFVLGHYEFPKEFEKVDGIIIHYSINKDDVTRKKILEKSFEHCNDDGVIVQYIDSLNIVPKMQNIIKTFNNDCEIIYSDSFKDVEKLKNNLHNVKIDDSIKLEIMREYQEKTGKKIKAGTVYKGYSIGTWKNNLIRKHYTGKLNMDREIKEEFVQAGILGDRKKRERTTDEYKFNLIMDFIKNNPNSHINVYTKNEDGIPIGEYRFWLQTKINDKKANLTDEQIQLLKDNRLLRNIPSKDERKHLIDKYKISEKLLSHILKNYGTVENFIDDYKSGKIDIENNQINKRGIIISKDNLLEKEKQKQIKILNDAFEENRLDDLTNFVVYEEVISALGKLKEHAKEMINRRLERYPNKLIIYSDLAKEFGVSRAYVEEVYKKGMKKLGKSIKIYNIEDLCELKEKIANELDIIKPLNEDEWKEYNMGLGVENLSIKPHLLKALIENGYEKISDIKEEKLLDIPFMGRKKIDAILNSIEQIRNSDKDEKVEDLESKLKDINIKIEAYNKAYKHYIEEENIFVSNEIIPSTIINNSEPSILDRKKEEKNIKEEELRMLDVQITDQDKKTERIQEVFGKENLNLDNKEVEE